MSATYSMSFGFDQRQSVPADNDAEAIAYVRQWPAGAVRRLSRIETVPAATRSGFTAVRTSIEF